MPPTSSAVGPAAPWPGSQRHGLEPIPKAPVHMHFRPTYAGTSIHKIGNIAHTYYVYIDNYDMVCNK